MRGASTISRPLQTGIEGWIDAVGGMVIHTVCPLEVAIERAFARGEDFIPAEKFIEIASAYELVFADLTIESYRFDTTRYSSLELGYAIAGMMCERRA
jgi:hypothetical protein